MARKKSKKTLQQEIMMVAYALIIMMLVIIAQFRLGILGVFLHRIFLVLFGSYPIFVYALLFIVALGMLFKKQLVLPKGKISFGLILALVALYLYLALASTTIESGLSYLTNYLSRALLIFNESLPAQAGIFGAILYGVVSFLVAREGTWVVLVTITIFSLYLLVGPIIFPSFTFKMPSLFTKDKVKKKDKPTKDKQLDLFETPSAQSMDEAIAKSEAKKSVFIDSDSVTNKPPSKPAVSSESKTTSAATIDVIKSYTLPSLSLLDAFKSKKGSSINNTVDQRKGKQLIELL